jgi:hypothetical protein
VVQGLRHRLRLPVERVREELARLIGVSPKTLKGWEYRYCSPQNWRRFAEAVKAFLERAEAGKRFLEKEQPYRGRSYPAPSDQKRPRVHRGTGAGGAGAPGQASGEA